MRLVTSEDLEQNEGLEQNERVRYCALSHCWGGTVGVKLTKNNVKAMMEGIEFRDLPRNFQDAITITRGLGVRYVWSTNGSGRYSRR